MTKKFGAFLFILLLFRILNSGASIVVSMQLGSV